ncbi:MAG TPA: hypothetical protein VHD36_03920 [Pirellulales bacterium]|nr:hypothetical protein [Pirellulales bacterium]
MDQQIALPPNLSAQVVAVGNVVTAADVDSFGRLRDIEDKSHKLRTILQAWEKQHTEERKLRKNYAWGLLIALFVQLGLVNVAFFLIGYGELTLPESAMNTFIVSVFGEIAAMAFIVTKYLFPKTGSEILALIEKL